MIRKKLNQINAFYVNESIQFLLSLAMSKSKDYQQVPYLNSWKNWKTTWIKVVNTWNSCISPIKVLYLVHALLSRCMHIAWQLRSSRTRGYIVINVRNTIDYIWSKRRYALGSSFQLSLNTRASCLSSYCLLLFSWFWTLSSNLTVQIVQIKIMILKITKDLK